MTLPRSPRAPALLAALLWAAACAGGLGALWAYKLRPDSSPAFGCAL